MHALTYTHVKSYLCTHTYTHAHTHTQYVRDSVAKEKRAQFSLKRFEELVPTEKDIFIPPVFSQVKPGTCTYCGIRMVLVHIICTYPCTRLQIHL